MQDESVLSGKTIEQMEKTGEKVWAHGQEEEIELDAGPEGEAKEIAGIS